MTAFTSLNPFKIRVPSECQVQVVFDMDECLNPFKIRVPSE